MDRKPSTQRGFPMRVVQTWVIFPLQSPCQRASTRAKTHRVLFSIATTRTSKNATRTIQGIFMQTLLFSLSHQATPSSTPLPLFQQYSSPLHPIPFKTLLQEALNTLPRPQRFRQGHNILQLEWQRDLGLSLSRCEHHSVGCCCGDKVTHAQGTHAGHPGSCARPI